MSLTQFMWNLAGQESQLPEEDLTETEPGTADAVTDSDVQHRDVGRGNNNAEAATDVEDGEAQNSSSFGAFVSRFAGGHLPEEDSKVEKPGAPQEAPESPTSFFGSLFGGSPSPPPAVAEDEEDPPKPETDNSMKELEPKSEVVEESSGGGFGAFLSSLVAAETPEQQSPVAAARLDQIAEIVGASARDADKATKPATSKFDRLKFDDVDAEDVVEVLERVPRQKRPPPPKKRLIVSSEHEASLLAIEAKSALRKLKLIQQETDAVLQQDGRILRALPAPVPTVEAMQLSEEALAKTSKVLGEVEETRKPPIETAPAVSTRRSSVQEEVAKEHPQLVQEERRPSVKAPPPPIETSVTYKRESTVSPSRPLSSYAPKRASVSKFVATLPITPKVERRTPLAAKELANKIRGVDPLKFNTTPSRRINTAKLPSVAFLKPAAPVSPVSDARSPSFSPLKPLSRLPYKAHHAYIPAETPSRLTDFPKTNPGIILHPNRPMSMPAASAGSGGATPQIVVASIESRVVPRHPHAL